jgi:hypothetical protein
MATLVPEQEEVAAQTSVQASVEKFCELLSAKLTAAMTAGMDEVESIAKQLATNARVFGKAVVTNTPADDTPVERATPVRATDDMSKKK